MRVRMPPKKISSQREVKQDALPKIWRKSFRVTTITPIYGGGVNAGKPDKEMPIRASAIRGQLRYWWRLLRQNDPDAPLEKDRLFNEEIKVWGGMAEDGADCSSKVLVRIKNCTKPTIISYKEYARGRGRKYALFPARDNNTQLMEAGISADLILNYRGCDEKAMEWILKSLRWWMSFGGIGARTRRGLGSIAISNLEPVTVQEAEKFGCKLAVHPESCSTAIGAWEKAVRKLEQFRQGTNIGRRKGHDKESPLKSGRSYWPEPNAIRRITEKYPAKHKPSKEIENRFPRAAFGLPIIFHFVESSDPDDTELRPSNADRMASPIILKALPAGNGSYIPIAFQLPVDHLNTLHLTLDNSGDVTKKGHLPYKINAGNWWPSGLEEAKREASYESSPMLKYQGHDALSAFFNYFIIKG